MFIVALEDTEIDATIQGCRINNLRFAHDILPMEESPEDVQTLVSLSRETSPWRLVVLVYGLSESTSRWTNFGRQGVQS